ncbi:MAG: hypothetical protein JRI57_10295 [Deltaproteobacteria bacterium]|nr:hypothetical protein [Deltaproteobacteria bacterium]
MGGLFAVLDQINLGQQGPGGLGLRQDPGSQGFHSPPFKGIALAVLNRPGEAIQEINKSIELNDNVAIFRGRQSLDQDLAVRNAGLARACQQLAVTAVKYEPVNGAAHLFLRDITTASRAGAAAPLFTSGLLLGFANTESALLRVLSPANQATYRSLQFLGTEALGLTRDYAPMFEMPFARVGVSGGLGATEGSKLRQDHQAVAYGGGDVSGLMARRA